MTITANQRVGRYLKYIEVKCKCNKRKTGSYCDGGHIRWEVVDLFHRIRTMLWLHTSKEIPLIIHSGVRCEAWNIHENGERDSAHLEGLALDIKIPDGVSREEFIKICEVETLDGGLGVYPRFIHVDCRKQPPYRRWES